MPSDPGLSDLVDSSAVDSGTVDCHLLTVDYVVDATAKAVL
jgi:hypothetical protein